MKVLDIKLNYHCNNNCVLCCQQDTIKNELTMLHFDDVVAFLSENLSDECGNGQPVKLVLTGGEPTLHPDLIHIVATAREMGCKTIQLQTNATRLSDNLLLEQMLSAGVNNFGISLHGHAAAVHEAFTNTPGSYDKTIRALGLLHEHEANVAVNVVISKLNVDTLPELVTKVGREKLAQSIQLAFIHIIGRAANERNLVAHISQAAKKVRECIEIGRQYNLIVTSEAIPFCLMRGFERQVSELYFRDEIIVFDRNGTMRFDQQRKNEFKLKCDRCRECLFYKLCEGPWIEYPEYFGWDEFVPIREFKY